MRDINKKIKMEFVKYIENFDMPKKNKNFLKKLFPTKESFF